MNRSGFLSAIAVVAVTGILLALSLVAGNSPLLGLDLQGGAEIVLRPSDDADNLALANDPINLERSAEIIRKRVDAIGVAEPDVTVQGTDLVVQLPGDEIGDQQRAIELVGQTAELRFRPVLLGPVPLPLLGEAAADFGGSAAIEGIAGGPGSDEFFAGELTDPRDDREEQSVILLSDPADSVPSAYLLGPTRFTGAALQGASAINTGIGSWAVAIDFLEGDSGVGRLNEVAGICYSASPECPIGIVAVVLDSTVTSTNGFEAPTFDDTGVMLNREGGFPEEEAVDSALILDFGALPLAFDDPAEAGLIRSVSATLGRDSLNAGLIAGAVGVGLVALYMLWFYRLLGLSAMLSLLISATLLWIIVAWLSESQGLALTLAGVVGLIVAIGVSLDSNVVYFEHIKEDIAAGRPLKAAADAAFPVAFRTVFWANMATLIGAAILYFLTVGSVKGFALMLGIASVLDLIATWFFMRPLVSSLVGALGDRPKLFGVRDPRAGAVGAGKDAVEAVVEGATT